MNEQQQKKQKSEESKTKAMQDINMCADILVQNKLISREEAKKQVDSIQAFFNKKMTYAEMRSIAG